MSTPTHDHAHTSALPHRHADGSPHTRSLEQTTPCASRLSVLAWPAWLRVAVVMPVVVVLWLGLAWANAGATQW
jgi:hypothetical protein